MHKYVIKMAPKKSLNLEARGTALVDEETAGEGITFGLRDFWIRVLERAIRYWEPGARADLQKVDISRSEVYVDGSEGLTLKKGA